MYLLDWVPRMFVYIFIITSMLSIGLQTSIDDLFSVVTSRKPPLHLLIANFLFVPLLGLLLIRFIPMEPEVSIALLVLACTPGGPSALQFSTKVRDSLPFAADSVFILSFLALFVSPVLIRVLLPHSLPVIFSYGKALRFIFLLMFVPLLSGVGLSRYRKTLAEKLSRPIALAGTLSFVVVVVLLWNIRQEAMAEIGTTAVRTLFLFVLLSMAIGWFMGGPELGKRQVLATTTSMRNVALCLLFAVEGLQGMDIETPLVAFSALMISPNLLLTVFCMIGRKKKNLRKQ